MEVLSSAERVVVSAGRDELIRFWDITTQKIIATAENLPKHPRWAMTSSPDGQLLAVGENEGNLRIYSGKSQ